MKWTDHNRISRKNRNLSWRSRKGVTIEEKWQKIKKIVYGAMNKRKKKTKTFELLHKDWWDRSSRRREKYREYKRIYRKWRLRKIGKREYMEESRKFKELKEKKKQNWEIWRRRRNRIERFEEGDLNGNL